MGQKEKAMQAFYVLTNILNTNRRVPRHWHARYPKLASDSPSGLKSCAITGTVIKAVGYHWKIIVLFLQVDVNMIAQGWVIAPLYVGIHFITICRKSMPCRCSAVL